MTNKKGGFNPVVAAATGAIVGAGVAIAGAVAMKDKKNREKVKEVFNEAKQKISDVTKGGEK